MRFPSPRVSTAVALAFAGAMLQSAAAAQSPRDWPDPIAHDVVPYEVSGLTHGPILGRPEATRMRIWIRTKAPMPFRIVYDTRIPFTAESPAVKGNTRGRDDNTAFVDLEGLRSNTRYYYGITTAAGLADTRMEFDRPWPSFRTLPDETSYVDPLNNPDGAFNFSFSIGCCQRQFNAQEPELSKMYASAPSLLTLYKQHADDISFHIIHGDFIYEEDQDGTREGYARNYQLYFERGRNLANLFRYVPLIATYDDHEMNANIDGSGEIGLGDGSHLHRDPAVSVWQQYVGWTDYASPYKAPLRFGNANVEEGSDVLFDAAADFTTLRPEQVSTIHVGPYITGDGQTKADRGGANAGVYGLVRVIDRNRLQVRPAFKTSGAAPYSIGTHHYFDRKIGNCHFLFLDTRGERSKFLGEAHAHDPDRFILGETQRNWLLETARSTDAAFLFVISPDPWVIYHSGYHVKPEGGTGSKGDGFCGHVHEREILLNAFDAIEKPVLIFTGDVHNSFSVQITDNVWEFMCGPMNSEGHPIGTAGLPPFGGWFDSEGRKVKVKWVAGFPDNIHYSRIRNTYYAVVNVNNLMKAARPEGVGYQFVPYDEPQAVVQFYDGFTGKLQYAEGISTADAKRDQTVAPKISRWPPGVAP